jgi:hypothetical protein
MEIWSEAWQHITRTIHLSKDLGAVKFHSVHHSKAAQRDKLMGGG